MPSTAALSASHSSDRTSNRVSRRASTAIAEMEALMPLAKSKAQARLFGAVAGGKTTKATGMSSKEAKKRLEGVKITKLPTRKKKKK